MPTHPAIGQPAPDFSLPGWHAGRPEEFTLSAARGRPVVLVFYPGDGTRICTKQLCSYSERWDDLTSADATIWAISRQGLDSHAAFAQQRELAMPLLADLDQTVATAYGVNGRFIRRSVFVVDANGDLAWAHVARLGLTYRSADEIIDVLRRLPT